MGSGGNFKVLKEIIYGLMDANGNMRVIPIGMIGNRSLPEDRLDLIRSLIRLLLETDYLCYESKEYLRHRDLSMAKVYRNLIEEGYYTSKAVTERAVISKIYRDQQKVDTELGSGIAIDLMSKVKSPKQYQEKIALAFTSTQKGDIRDQIEIDIPRNKVATTIDDEKWEEFLTILLPYVHSFKSQMESNLSDDCVGYFNFITSCGDSMLSEADIERKKNLLEMIKTGSFEISGL